MTTIPRWAIHLFVLIIFVTKYSVYQIGRKVLHKTPTKKHNRSNHLNMNQSDEINTYKSKFCFFSFPFLTSKHLKRQNTCITYVKLLFLLLFTTSNSYCIILMPRYFSKKCLFILRIKFVGLTESIEYEIRVRIIIY